MLVKLGVYIDKLERPIRRKLKTIDLAFMEIIGAEAVISSTNEGNHGAGSLHYANLAIDLRKPGGATRIVLLLQTYLGKNFDVIEEPSHIHIEYDPKP